MLMILFSPDGANVSRHCLLSAGVERQSVYLDAACDPSKQNHALESTSFLHNQHLTLSTIDMSGTSDTAQTTWKKKKCLASSYGTYSSFLSAPQNHNCATTDMHSRPLQNAKGGRLVDMYCLIGCVVGGEKRDGDEGGA